MVKTTQTMRQGGLNVLMNTRAFTLLEMLISSAILVTLALMMASISTNLLSNWGHFENKVTSLDARRPLEETLLFDLQQMQQKNQLPKFPDDPSQPTRSQIGFFITTPQPDGSKRPLAYLLYDWDSSTARLTRQLRPYAWDNDVPPFGRPAPSPNTDPLFEAHPPIEGVLAMAVSFQEDNAQAHLKYDSQKSRYIRVGWVQASPKISKILQDRGLLAKVVSGLTLSDAQVEAPFNLSWAARINSLVAAGDLPSDLAPGLRIIQVIRPLPESES